MGFFDDSNEINITNDFDANDAVHYVLIFLLVVFLVLYYVVNKCKKMKREIASAQGARRV